MRPTSPQTKQNNKQSSKCQEYEGGGAEDLALRMDVPAGSDDSGSEDEARRAWGFRV